jgi:hypothetical protein
MWNGNESVFMMEDDNAAVLLTFSIIPIKLFLKKHFLCIG